VAAIARIARVLKHHPAFGPSVALSLIGRGEDNFIALLRRHRTTGRRVVVVANLDWQRPVTAGWDRNQAAWLESRPVDLLGGQAVELQSDAQRQWLTISPGQVLCLADAGDGAQLAAAPDTLTPPAVLMQQMRAKALEVLTHYGPAGRWDLQQAEEALQGDPERFCRELNPHGDESRVVAWEYPADLNRRVMVPPDHFLLVRSAHPFQVRILDRDRVCALENSLTDRNRRPFALIKPLPAGDRHRLRSMEINVHTPEGTRHDQGRLLYLCQGDHATVKLDYSRRDWGDTPLDTHLSALGTDGRGAMMRAHADWGRLESRYDALLAANLSDEYPEDRRVMLSRYRGWMVFQGHYQEIRLKCLRRFAFDHERGGVWDFQIPTGQGEHVRLRFSIQMPEDPANTVGLQIRRLKSRPERAELDDRRPVQVILRPDIEDRNFHQTTKAYTGPENLWPAAIATHQDGFTFTPATDRRLQVHIDHGSYVHEPEWAYMVHRPREAQRGLDADSDLFSPGYFSAHIQGGKSVILTARVTTGNVSPPPSPGPAYRFHLSEDRPPDRKPRPLGQALEAALVRYIVRRGDFRSVIAGFPWFLDWGRDTLIVARGLAAAGHRQTVEAILCQFARFEKQGTLPNMIHGDNAANRDTSDAPLWLFTVCADLAAASGGTDFLENDCGGRPLGKVLTDLAASIIAGTPNGVGMDAASGLIYSPAHFTWMDTNYPAGTPRQGYPVEIQALWFAALGFLSRIDGAESDRWSRLAEQVRHSMLRLFWNPDQGYLVDCRHAVPGQSAEAATPDDALRPNQLLAITLGAVADPGICRRILHACQALLVPGAIRSLADRPVDTPLEIVRDGKPLNDPRHPYWGRYAGDEDTRRKPAYHNGTAWTWLFPSYCEAWCKAYGPQGIPTARAWLASATELIDRYCIGHLPEIVDGNDPHTQRGCDAQAWGASELLRVWIHLRQNAPGQPR
jgi:glycogen debranching enzyme